MKLPGTSRLGWCPGRKGARGHLYLPLIPNFLDLDCRPRDNYFQKQVRIWIGENKGEVHCKAQLEDAQRFDHLASEANKISQICQKERLLAGADFMTEQAESEDVRKANRLPGPLHLGPAGLWPARCGCSQTVHSR